jgi:predicted lipoprotein with Yx(FWY)xxD motif
MRLKYIFLCIPSLLMFGSMVSCSKSSGSGGTPPPPPPPVVSIQLKNDSKFGSILTNSSGHSIYFFAPDANGSSACTGGCLTNWPAVYVSSLTVSAGLDLADFETITRSDGAKQTTYKGWPLYTYSGDVTSGGGGYGAPPVTNSISGDGINGTWFVAKPDYTVMLARTQLVGNDGISYDSMYMAGSGNTIYMTDDRGVTLYSFSFDKSATNNYTKADFSNDGFWPIVQISAVQNVPSVLDKSAFATITVFGKPQMTYKGWPVYRFGPDANERGSTKGVSVPTPGVWQVMDRFSAEAPQ